MTLNLKSNNGPIDPNDQQYQDVLADLQGNILKGHGRDKSVHIFLTFPNPEETEKIGKLKEWIAQLAASDITSAKKQLNDAKEWRENKIDGGTFVHFSLSSSGYKKLGFPDSEQPKGSNPQNRIPSSDVDYADLFQQGMKQRIDKLSDPPLTDWDEGFQKQIDALVILADDQSTNLSRKQTDIIAKLGDIATVARVEQGDTLRYSFDNVKKLVVEHFGYADGIGQPLFLKQDVDKEEGETAKKLFSAPLNLVLTPDPFGTPNVSFGSFLVFRKLEQNVQEFKKAEVALGRALGISPKLVGAMAVGRFEDGTPIVLQPNDGQARTNDFNYSGDSLGLKCPFQAHVRKTNPRLESVLKNGPFAQSTEQELGHRIARRGVNYGGPLSNFSDLDSLPTRGVGLLFMCYQADIWEQFEFIQRFWCNAPEFLEPKMSEARKKEDPTKEVNPNYKQTGLDAVIGQSTQSQSPENWPQGWAEPTKKPGVNFAKFVTLKGGEYFFSPSINFLKNLSNPPQDSTPTQEPTPGRTYVVQEIDFLFSLAERAYGDGNKYTLIYEANREVIGPDPNVIIAGQVLFIPISS